jgi:hypothetical protein
LLFGISSFSIITGRITDPISARSLSKHANSLRRYRCLDVETTGISDLGISMNMGMDTGIGTGIGLGLGVHQLEGNGVYDSSDEQEEKVA